MGDAIIPKPIFFLKPPSAAACGQCAGDPVRVTVPRGRGSCHYETEVVFRVGPDGAGFDAVTLGLDLTLRDEQNAAKKAGHPWEAAKVKREEKRRRGEEEKRRRGEEERRGCPNPPNPWSLDRSLSLAPLLSRLVHGFAPCGASAPHMPPHAGGRSFLSLSQSRTQVFPGSAVIGPWVPLPAFPDWAHVLFSFSLDGQVVQSGMGSDMMLAPEPALAAARDLFGIVPGDWLFTGTPAGGCGCGEGRGVEGGDRRSRARGRDPPSLFAHHPLSTPVLQASALCGQASPAPLPGATRWPSRSSLCSRKTTGNAHVRKA